MSRRVRSDLVDRTGQRYGKLTAISYAGPYYFQSGSMGTRWNVRCDCGNEFPCRTTRLKVNRFGCEDCTIAAHTIPDDERICKWCRRHTGGPTHNRHHPVKECGACNRMAHRYGRHANGRPIARGKRWVTKKERT